MKKPNMVNETSNKQMNRSESQKSEIADLSSKGTIVFENDCGNIKFERYLSVSKELVWQAITNFTEVAKWMSDYKGKFDRREGGSIDLINVVSGSHVTGHILTWHPCDAFEYEWHIDSNPLFPGREPRSIVRWDLYEKKEDSTNNTRLTMSHKYLSKSTSLMFTPGWHAYLDRLEAILNDQSPPDFLRRVTEIKEMYSTL